MISRKISPLKFLLVAQTVLLSKLQDVAALEEKSPTVVPYPIRHKEGHVQFQSDLSTDSKVQILKFGEIPTNRVLPVDHLTEADYEGNHESDHNNEIEDVVANREDCARLFKADFMKAMKNERRKARQDTEQDEEQEGILANYFDLEFDPSKVVGPLLNIMGSAAARNSTAIDENYKKLPPFVKTQVADFIQDFNELLKTIQTAK